MASSNELRRRMGELPWSVRIFILAFVLCIPMIVMTQRIPSDVARLYAPVAREVAEGNWDRAFYPMSPPLIPTLAGLLARILTMDAYTGLMLLSSLTFALGVFPVHAITSDLFGSRAARWSAVLYVFCRLLLRYASNGLLTAPKTFLFLLLVYALHRRLRGDRGIRAILLFVLSAAGLSLVRVEGFFLVCFAFIAHGGMEVLSSRKREMKFWLLPWETILAGVTYLLVLSPQFLYQMNAMGYPMLDMRHLPLAKMVLDPLGYVPSTVPILAEGMGTPWYVPAPQSAVEVISQIVKGFYPLYLLFAVPVLIQRVRRKQSTCAEWLLLGSCAVHTLVFLIIHTQGGNVSRRYIVAAAPLCFGWASVGMIHVYNFLTTKWKPSKMKWIHGVLGLAMVICYYDAVNWARPRYNPVEREYSSRVLPDLADWLANEGVQRVPAAFEGLRATKFQYHNGKKPVVLGRDWTLLYRCKGDQVMPPQEVTEETELLRLCDAKQIHYVVVDEKLARIYPTLEDLDALPESFSIVYDRWRSREIVILAFKPNLNS